MTAFYTNHFLQDCLITGLTWVGVSACMWAKNGCRMMALAQGMITRQLVNYNGPLEDSLAVSEATAMLLGTSEAQ